MSGYLLDTHAWLWLAIDQPGLDGETCDALRSAVSEVPICLATISVWELAMLEAKRRIVLNQPIESWVEDAVTGAGLHLIPLSVEVALASTRLPGPFHGDPADRMIVATARAHGLSIVTRDRGILAYGGEGYVRALPL